MPSTLRPIHFDLIQDAIRCPQCKNESVELTTLNHEVLNNELVEIYGSGFCTGCKCISSPPLRNSYEIKYQQLDISFSWSIISNRVRATSAFTSIYEYTPNIYLGQNIMPSSLFPSHADQAERVFPSSSTIYAVVAGTGKDYHLVLVTGNRTMATRTVAKSIDGECKVLEFPCKDLPESSKPFKVFVVSVGEGETYRIINIVLDEKTACKMATSIRGAVSYFDALPTEVNTVNLKYYKYFVPLESDHNYGGHDEDCDDEDCDGCRGGGSSSFYVDYFTRRVSVFENENPSALVTRRRRYSSSLPYRFEVASPNRCDGEVLADFIACEVESGRLDLEDFEFNADCEFRVVDGKWKLVA